MIVLTLGFDLHSAGSHEEVFLFLTAALHLYHSHCSIHSSSRPPAFHFTEFHLLYFTEKTRPCPTSTTSTAAQNFMAAVALEPDVGWLRPHCTGLTQTLTKTHFFFPLPFHCVIACISQFYLRLKISVKLQQIESVLQRCIWYLYQRLPTAASEIGQRMMLLAGMFHCWLTWRAAFGFVLEFHPRTLKQPLVNVTLAWLFSRKRENLHTFTTECNSVCWLPPWFPRDFLRVVALLLVKIAQFAHVLWKYPVKLA